MLQFFGGRAVALYALEIRLLQYKTVVLCSKDLGEGVAVLQLCDAVLASFPGHSVFDHLQYAKIEGEGLVHLIT